MPTRIACGTYLVHDYGFSTLKVTRLDRGYCNPARCLRTLSLSRLDGELGARKANKAPVLIMASSSQPVFLFI